MKPIALALSALALGVGGVAALEAQPSPPSKPGLVDVSRVAGGTYVADGSHSLVAWSVDHFGFNDYFGLFGDVEGTLTIDPANPSEAMVDVTVPITSVAVVSDGLRDHLLRPGKDGAEPDFFGPEPEPARFVRAADGGRRRDAGNHRCIRKAMIPALTRQLSNSFRSLGLASRASMRDAGSMASLLLDLRLMRPWA